jgi:hypothetical protein
MIEWLFAQAHVFFLSLFPKGLRLELINQTIIVIKWSLVDYLDSRI